MYSEFAVNGLDTNGDGIYSEQELQPLAQTNIEALKEFSISPSHFWAKRSSRSRSRSRVIAWNTRTNS